MTLHREGNKILLGLFSVLSLLNAWLYFGASSWNWMNAVLLVISLIIFLIFAQFFRVPKRTVTAKYGEVICPADGKVVVIEEVEESEFFVQPLQLFDGTKFRVLLAE